MQQQRKQYDAARAETAKRQEAVNKAAMALNAADPDTAKEWTAADAEHRRALAGLTKAQAAENAALEALRAAERAEDEARMRNLQTLLSEDGELAAIQRLEERARTHVQGIREVMIEIATERETWDQRRKELLALAEKLGRVRDVRGRLKSGDDVFVWTGLIRERIHNEANAKRKEPITRIGNTIVPAPSTIIETME